MVSCKKDPGSGSREAVAEAGYEMTPEALFRAAESDDLKALEAMLAGGLPLETKNATGQTVLHAAAGAGAMKSMSFLLDRGLPVDVIDQGGRTPLMEAVLRADGQTVRHLLAQGADPRAKDADKYKPLMLAVREGKAAMVTELAPYVREDLDDALLVASILGQAAVIDELTNYGASVYARLDDGRTPLMLAAQNGRDDAADMLLAIGANRFGMDEQGRTASDLAREQGHVALADRLADEPVAGDFELSEPAELGAEMVEEVAASQPESDVVAANGDGEASVAVNDLGGSAADESGEVSGGASLANETGSVREGIPATSQEAALGTLEGAVVGAKQDASESTSSSVAANETGSVPSGSAGPNGGSPNAAPSSDRPQEETVPIVMRSYREKELPLRVDSTAETSATLRVAGGEPVTVEQGSSIPGSSLQIIHISRRMQSGKNDGGTPVEVSVVSVRDSRSGVERDLVVGLPALAHDPVALVEDSASGSYYVARTGQRFRSASGEDYLVGDVRPNQIVIENMKTGETTTLPLRGPRG